MSRQTLRIGVLLAALAAFTVGGAGVASGGGEIDPTVELSSVTVTPGSTLTFSNTANFDSQCENGFVEWQIVGEDGETVIDMGEVEPDESGDWSVNWPVPADLAPGDYFVVAECIEEVGGLADAPFDYPAEAFQVVGAQPQPEPIEPDVPALPIDAAPSLTG